MKVRRILFVILALSVLTASSYGMTYLYKYYTQTKTLTVVPASKPKDNKQKTAVVSIIKRHLSEIEDCYNQRLEEGLNDEGSLKIGWLLDGSGEASQLEEMQNELGDPDLYECSAEAISQWKFPKDLVIQVHYTFHLRQKRQPSSKNFESSIEEL
jgi:hypothetical protein